MPRAARIIIPAVAVVAAAYASGWYYAAGEAEGAVRAIAERRDGGVTIDIGGVSRGGFPLALDIAATDIAVAGPDGLSAAAAGFTASAKPWRLPEVDFVLAAPVTVTVPGSGGLVAATNSDGTGTVEIDTSGQPTGGAIILSELTLTGAPLPEPIAIDRIELAADRNPEEEGAGAVARLDLAGIAVPTTELSTLGAEVDRAGGQVTVLGPLPASPSRADLAAWRDAGGKLRVDRLDLTWGPLMIDASGTLALDDDLQPQGELTAKVRGYEPVIQALTEAGLIGAREAGFATVGLGLLAGQPDAEGVKTVTAPIVIGDGKISLGPIQIAQLPEIVWP